MTPIQKAKEIAEDKYPYPELNPEINNTLVQFRIDALREGYAAALLSGEGWISVKAAMPDELGEVLVLTKRGNVYLDSYCANNGNGPFGWNHSRVEDITHWIKIPEPPKP